MQTLLSDRFYQRHLRIIHACEKGATGVYWGHRLIATLLYRNMLPQLNEMHRHEVEHFEIFGKLMQARGVRTVITPVFWCVGGILYGVITALAGRRAIWRSTAVIEAIVERELNEAAIYFQIGDPEVYQAIQQILIDELEHKLAGEANSPGAASIDRVIEPAARGGATAAKELAKRL
ncbi:demethoxyubiquinone hydroxylase family protein [Aquipseudomonas alcaligenes]|uniref:demethoxyubiquinone hydroxylase family protein n=1 Tax=Aquipseudomonas alcaligenes TaxID=43263 RepID=UPI0037487F2B